MRSQEEQGGAKKSQEEPGGARRFSCICEMHPASCCSPAFVHCNLILFLSLGNHAWNSFDSASTPFFYLVTSHSHSLSAPPHTPLAIGQANRQ